MTLQNRNQSFEKKSAQDDEFVFRVRSKRAYLLGLWAAEKLNLAKEKYESYANAIMLSDLEKPGNNDFINKIKCDFEQAGLNISEHEINRELNYLYEKAKEQLTH